MISYLLYMILGTCTLYTGCCVLCVNYFLPPLPPPPLAVAKRRPVFPIIPHFPFPSSQFRWVVSPDRIVYELRDPTTFSPLVNAGLMCSIEPADTVRISIPTPTPMCLCAPKVGGVLNFVVAVTKPQDQKDAADSDRCAA